MFGLTFRGTSASFPSTDRNHPGLLVEAGSDRILVDCGEGRQRQLLRSGVGFRGLDRPLLTHGHFDNVLGIPGLFSTLRLQQSADVMRFMVARALYSPRRCKDARRSLGRRESADPAGAWFP
jgi:ribonuclease Z